MGFASSTGSSRNAPARQFPLNRFMADAKQSAQLNQGEAVEVQSHGAVTIEENGFQLRRSL